MNRLLTHVCYHDKDFAPRGKVLRRVVWQVSVSPEIVERHILLPSLGALATPGFRSIGALP